MSVQPQQNLTSTWLKVRCRHHHFFHSVQVKDICEEDCYIWKQHCHLNVFLRFVLFFFPWEGWISGASKRCGGSWNLGVSGILTRHCFFFFSPPPPAEGVTGLRLGRWHGLWGVNFVASQVNCWNLPLLLTAWPTSQGHVLPQVHKSRLNLCQLPYVRLIDLRSSLCPKITSCSKHIFKKEGMVRKEKKFHCPYFSFLICTLYLCLNLYSWFLLVKQHTWRPRS